jgi:hypothetical protein
MRPRAGSTAACTKVACNTFVRRHHMISSFDPEILRKFNWHVGLTQGTSLQLRSLLLQPAFVLVVVLKLQLRFLLLHASGAWLIAYELCL